MYELLQEREEVRPDLSDWVLTEALNSTKLQLGGTFRNVLARKIDEVITPLLANIIAFADRYYNLNLLDPKKTNPALTNLWLAMFRSTKVTVLKYSENVQGEKLLGIGRRKLDQTFQCKMPFFWIIKEAVESVWNNANRFAGKG